jgi:hypothetical protein
MRIFLNITASINQSSKAALFWVRAFARGEHFFKHYCSQTQTETHNPSLWANAQGPGLRNWHDAAIADFSAWIKG